MPYIAQERRKIIDNNEFPLPGTKPVAGDYVYWYYSKMIGIYKRNPSFETIYRIRLAVNGDYSSMFDWITAPFFLKISDMHIDQKVCLLLAWDEFYRRIVAPHENKKIGENGDVI